MASVRLLTQDGEKYFEVSGAGSILDPYRTVQEITGSTEVTGSVSIVSMPEIPVTIPSTIDIATLPDVVIASMPNVTITAMPNVVIASMPNVTIASLPSVTIASLPNVVVSGTPNVVVTSLPNVVLSGTPNVAISGTPTVNVGTMPTVAVSALPSGTNIIGAVYDAGPRTASDRFSQTYADGSAGVFGCAPPTGGQRRVFTDVVVSVNTDCYVELLEETSLTLIAGAWLKASGGFEQLVPRGKLFLPTINRRLVVKTTPASQVSVMSLSISEA